MNAPTATLPLCRTCRQPIEPEEMAHPNRLGPTHLAPVLCAIATIRARKAAQEATP